MEAVHTGQRCAGLVVAVRTVRRAKAVHIDLDQAQVDTGLESVGRSHLVGLVDVPVGQMHQERAVGRIVVGAGRNSWILAGRRHAGCIGHVEVRCVHILPVLVLYRIVKCYAVVKFGHIDLVVVEESCTSFDPVLENRILLHLDAALEADTAKKIDVALTAYSLQVVRCRCMFRSVLWKCIRSCCAARNHEILHLGYPQAYHQDRPMSAVESSVVPGLAGCEACFLRPGVLMRAGLRDHHHQNSVQKIHVIAFHPRGNFQLVVLPSLRSHC